MKETSTGQEILQVLTITFLTVCVMCFGGYGLKLAINEQTTEAWQIWGAFLFTVIIIFPTAGFWSKQISKLFNIED